MVPGLIAFTCTPSRIPASAIALVNESNAAFTEPPMVNWLPGVRPPAPVTTAVFPVSVPMAFQYYLPRNSCADSAFSPIVRYIVSKEYWSWASPGNRPWAAPWSAPWAAFGFGHTGRFFEAGEVRLAILSLLGEG